MTASKHVHSIITTFNKLRFILKSDFWSTEPTNGWRWVNTSSMILRLTCRNVTKLDLMDGMFKLNRGTCNRRLISWRHQEICLKTGITLANEYMDTSMNYRIEQIPKNKKWHSEYSESSYSDARDVLFFNREGKLEIKELTDSGIVLRILDWPRARFSIRLG